MIKKNKEETLLGCAICGNIPKFYSGVKGLCWYACNNSKCMNVGEQYEYENNYYALKNWNQKQKEKNESRRI